ncbi:MAG: peptide deformylase [Spirochaetales bacterium]|nr:peptide deformylase [Spirochaetales bacterium]
MLSIVTLGDELLQKSSNYVEVFDKELSDYTDKMFEAMLKFKGIGLASVQVGRLDRIFVVQIPNDEPRVFINPEIIETSVEEDHYEEGCLSIPGVNADVIRPYYVKIQAYNLKGRPFKLEAEDLLARVIQHELDHLNGVLFIDHVDSELKNRLVTDYHQRKEKLAE